jgi:hypothetical protein
MFTKYAVYEDGGRKVSVRYSKREGGLWTVKTLKGSNGENPEKIYIACSSPTAESIAKKYLTNGTFPEFI